MSGYTYIPYGMTKEAQGAMSPGLRKALTLGGTAIAGYLAIPKLRELLGKVFPSVLPPEQRFFDVIDPKYQKLRRQRESLLRYILAEEADRLSRILGRPITPEELLEHRMISETARQLRGAARQLALERATRPYGQVQFGPVQAEGGDPFAAAGAASESSAEASPSATANPSVEASPSASSGPVNVRPEISPQVNPNINVQPQIYVVPTPEGPRYFVGPRPPAPGGQLPAGFVDVNTPLRPPGLESAAEQIVPVVSRYNFTIPTLLGTGAAGVWALMNLLNKEKRQRKGVLGSLAGPGLLAGASIGIPWLLKKYVESRGVPVA